MKKLFLDALREGGLVGDGANGQPALRAGSLYQSQLRPGEPATSPSWCTEFTGIISKLVPTCSNRTPMVLIEFDWNSTDWRRRRKKSTLLPWIS